MIPELCKRSSLILICIVLVTILFGLSVTQPHLAQVKADWTYSSGYDPHGGYVDRLIFVVYPNEELDQALLDLQHGHVFSYDEHIFLPAGLSQHLYTLIADPAIEVSSELGSRYQYVVFQCQRFPTNLTGYRRALAYALDKYAAVEHGVGGYGQVMDTPIPLAYAFWKFEDQIQEHFYTEDIAKANASLDAAHIIDTPDSPHPGWRYYDANMNGIYDEGIDLRGDVAAPDGLNIELWVSAGYSPAIQAMTVQLAGMKKCGLQGEVVEVDFNAQIAILHQPGYSLVCFGFTVDPPGIPTHLYDYFHTTGDSNAFLFRYDSSEFDYNATRFLEAQSRLEARNWAWNCCRILLQDMPTIICFNLEAIHAYRTDIWEGYVNQVGVNRMGGNPYTYQKLRLKETARGPFGCYPAEYITVLTNGIDYTNTILSGSRYSQTIFNLIYSKLWRIDPLDPFTECAPDLAYNWTLTPTTASGDIQDGMKYTFQLYENISWHDGTPFTAEDVQYSLMTIYPWSPYYSEDVASIYRVDTPTNHTVEIYSNEKRYVTFIKATSLQILPKHIWNSHESENFSWFPATPSDFTGTNCFRWVGRIPWTFEDIILDRYDGWHFAVTQPLRIQCPLPLPPLWITMIVAFGVLIIAIQIIVIGYLLHRRRKRQVKKEAEDN